MDAFHRAHISLQAINKEQELELLDCYRLDRINNDTTILYIDTLTYSSTRNPLC